MNTINGTETSEKYLFIWMQDKAHRAETAILTGNKKEALRLLDILNTQLDILVTTATEDTPPTRTH